MKVKRKPKAAAAAAKSSPNSGVPARRLGNSAIGKGKKGRRKEKKATFLERLKATQSSLVGTKEQVLASVRQLGESLPELKTKAAAPKRSKPLTNKSRNKLFGAEVSQFASVLRHGSFAADPLAAITLHLESTIDTREVQRPEGDNDDEDTAGPIRSRVSKAKKSKGGAKAKSGLTGKVIQKKRAKNSGNSQSNKSRKAGERLLRNSKSGMSGAVAAAAAVGKKCKLVRSGKSTSRLKTIGLLKGKFQAKNNKAGN